MPQLWPFLLQRLTPPGHRVTILDGNITPATPASVAAFVKDRQVDLVCMGFMTRMAQKAYQVAHAVRTSTGVPVVMGGPHVTAEPGEPLGEGGLPRYADAVVLGEADEIWPQVVADAAAGRLQPKYWPGPAANLEYKPGLKEYQYIQWDQLDLASFDLMRFVPPAVKKLLKQKLKIELDRIYIFPVESGRGCPYGCEFCSVTGFFGGEIRFRPAENVVAELQLIQEVAKRDRALAVIFFVDDNFAIHRERAKALLREMIRHGIDLPWCAQVSINLLKDNDLIDLMVESGGRWVFIGLESISPESLTTAHKNFNRPAEYGAILDNLARRGLFAITSFIYGLDADAPGCSKAVMDAIDHWPPVMPVFCLLTPLPGTPLYRRLEQEGRLTRPRHWLDFHANKAAFTPKRISSGQMEKELQDSWRHCYRAAVFSRTQRWMLKNRRPFDQQTMFFVFRLIFRGIYFPQKSKLAWITLLAGNIFTLLNLVTQAVRRLWRRRRSQAKMKPAGLNAGEGARHQANREFTGQP